MTVFPSCKILVFTILCRALIALNRVDAIRLILLTSVILFSFSQGHLAVLLIQIEILALLRIYVIFLVVTGNSPALYLSLLIFTVIAAEGGVGLAFLFKARRHSSFNIEKRRV